MLGLFTRKTLHNDLVALVLLWFVRFRHLYMSSEPVIESHALFTLSSMPASLGGKIYYYMYLYEDKTNHWLKKKTLLRSTKFWRLRKECSSPWARKLLKVQYWSLFTWSPMYQTMISSVIVSHVLGVFCLTGPWKHGPMKKWNHGAQN